MKVIHLISSLGLFGAEQVLLNLVTDRGGIEFYIGAIHNLHNPHLEIVEEAKKLGLPVASFPCAGKFDLQVIFTIKKYICNNNVDILHTHNYKSNLIGLLAARLAGIKLVATAHGYTDADRKVSQYEKLDRFILKFFDRVVVVADSVLPNFPTTRKVVIPNGIDVNHFQGTGDRRQETRAEFGFSASDLVIGTVGRLSKEKNQVLLLMAAGPLVAGDPNLKILIVGDGPELENLKGEVRQENLEKNVIFAGLRTDLPGIYSAMDIFVLPSLTEGVPLTILEAMAARVPVVATRVGGVPNLIEHDKTGLLVESKNVTDLIAKIKLLADDKLKRSILANAAYELVRSRYSLEKMRQSYQKIYENLLSAYA